MGHKNEKIYTNKKTRYVCLSICLSGYTFRHALMSQADILNIDRGHILRKHRHKTKKKVAVIYEKTVKNWPLLGYLAISCQGASMFPMPRGAYVYSAIFVCVFCVCAI